MSDDGEASILEDIDGIILIIDAVVVVINDKLNIPRNFKTLTRQPFLISKILEDTQTYITTANETTKTDLALTIEKCKDKAMDLYDLFLPEDCYSQLDKSIQVIKWFLDNLQGIITKFPETTTPRSKEALAKAIKEVSQMESDSFLNTDDLRRQTFTHFGSGPQNINTGNGIQYNEIQSNPVSRPPNVVQQMGLFAHFGSGHQNITTGNGNQYISEGGNQINGPGTQYIGTNFIA
jgi:alkaline phosphatase